MRIRNKRTRYFSLMFIPDQERNPKSISMSYLKGKLLLGLLALLVLHIIAGGIGYYWIFRLGKTTYSLKNENNDLKLRNKKIEEIVKEFQEIRMTDAKIRKAFGGSLGLSHQGTIALKNMKRQTFPRELPPEQAGSEVPSMPLPKQQIQSGLYFLSQENRDYFDPKYLPTLLPVEGFLTTHFQKGGWFVARTHYGIDIAAKKGSVIRAAGAGIVLIADWTPDFGNVVLISHGRGVFSYYAHAMRLLVSQGFKVKRGQPIALLGSSGISSAPHLHFEIWKDGKPLDPEKILFALPSQKIKAGL